MARYLVRDPTPEDVAWLAVNMRPQDMLEAREVADDDLEAVLHTAIGSSHITHAAERKGQVLAIYGTVPLSDGVGCLWCLATEDLYRAPGMLTRLTREHIAEVSDRFPTLINWVHEDNAASLRWLEWLGATIDEPAPFGRHGLPFRRFEIRADDVR